jgi:AbrB family looped-hinge helix DNA binding protein
MPFTNVIYHYILPLMANTVSIDKAGRIVIPKPLRDKLGLEAGDDLQIESDGDQITLRPTRPEPLMVKKLGIWVYNGEIPDIDIVDFIDEQREKRALEFLK